MGYERTVARNDTLPTGSEQDEIQLSSKHGKRRMAYTTIISRKAT